MLTVFVVTLLPSLAIVSLHHGDPPQVRASSWIEQHLPAKASIGIPRSFYWWTPSIVYISAHHPERLTQSYKVMDLHFSVPTAQRQRPDYILLSGAERTNWTTLQSAESRALLQWL